MLTQLIKNFLKEFYYFRRYKRRKQFKVNLYDFHHEVLQHKNYRPIFVLSTGRCGTRLLSDILIKDPENFVNHYLPPELLQQGNFAYEAYQIRSTQDYLTNKAIFLSYWAGREDMHWLAYNYGVRYIETSNIITFLAPYIKQYIPNARFIHLYRHPGAFISSGLGRGWYRTPQRHDMGRIMPIKNSNEFETWKQFSPAEKTAWLWNETNSFIESFLETLDSNEYIKLSFEDLVTNQGANHLKDFLNLKLPDGYINKKLKRPVNTRKKYKTKSFHEWSEEEKNKIKNICGQLADYYDYSL